MSTRRAAAPQVSFDTSANGTLTGAYFVRQVLTLTDASTSAILRAVSLTGTLTFDGNGHFTFAGQERDSSIASAASFYSTSGIYAVSSSGLVQIQNPIDTTDTDFGGVGASGAIVASATEGKYDDILVAIPVGPAGALRGSYQVGFIDFLGGDASNVRDGYYTLTPGGGGSFGNVTVSGAMANQGSTNTTQTFSGVTYSVSGSNGTIVFPTASVPSAALVSGTKSFALSADASILVGGSLDGFDLLVGLNSPTVVSNHTYVGTYFTGGLENDTSGFCGEPNCIDSFYGSADPNGLGAGTAHYRDTTFNVPAYDLTTDLIYNFPANGIYNDGAFEWMLGSAAEGVLQVGVGNYYSLVIGFQAKQYSGTGIFANPDGIVNAANFAPVTNSVAPGEYVALFGSSLGVNAQASSLPLPPVLGGAQVTVDGNSARLLAASPALLQVFVPNATPAYDLAAFQVNVNRSNSNQVTLYTAATAPGVFTSTANAIGPADVFHADYSYVTPNHPAVPGEAVFCYATGLGATTPAVPDAAAGPSNPTAVVNDPMLGVDIYDSQGNTNPAKVSYAALVAGLAGVYQINFTVPTGVAAGEGYLDVATTDGYTSEAKIYVGSPSASITSISSASPTAGPNNQTLTVFGSGFENGLTVTVGLPGGGGITLSRTQIQNLTATSFQMVITLSTVGTYNIRVNNPDGGQSNTFSFYVQAASPLIFEPVAVPSATIGAAYSFNFCSPPSIPCGGSSQQNPSGGVPPYHFQLDSGSFPPLGLVLDVNGVLSGTPAGNPGTYSFRVCAVDLAASYMCVGVTLTVNPSGGSGGSEAVTPSQAFLGTAGGCQGGQLSGTFQVSAPMGVTWSVTSNFESGEIYDGSVSISPLNGIGSGVITLTVAFTPATPDPGVTCQQGHPISDTGNFTVHFSDGTFSSAQVSWNYLNVNY